MGSFSSNMMRFVLPLTGIEAPAFLDLDGLITPNQVSRGLWFPHSQYFYGVWSRLRLVRKGDTISEIERPIFDASVDSSTRCTNMGYKYTFRHCVQQGCPGKFKTNPFYFKTVPHYPYPKSEFPYKLVTCHNSFDECCNLTAVQRCPWAKDWISKQSS